MRRLLPGMALLLGGAWLLTVEPLGVPAAAAGQQPAASPAASPERALVDRYCVTCHNARRKAGDLLLEQVDVDRAAAHPEVWERVIRKLSTGAMPPPGLPRPEKAASDALVASLKASIDTAAAKAPKPGRPAVHRLNRIEYTHAIRDLLGLEIDGPSLLPADDSGYGFDNVADVLKVSPGLLERYLLAAQKITRIAVGDTKMRPASAMYKNPYLTLLQDDRLDDDLPIGSRGGIVVRYYFPVNGDYVIKVRVQRNSLTHGGQVRGLDEDNQIDVRVDGQRVKVFTLGSRTDKQVEYFDENFGRTENKPTDEGLNLRIPIKAGTRVVSVAFEKRTLAPEGIGPSVLPAASFALADARVGGLTVGKVEMGIDHIQIDGPFAATESGDTPSRRRIFTCRPKGRADEERCAASILSALARRAYRRQVTREDTDALLAIYRKGKDDGGFEGGIRWALETILVDPDFLFRIERDPAKTAAGTVYRISDIELASRLSFFLWSTIPDDELLNLAIAGKLRDTAVLERQVRRMLSDDRSRALLTNFFGQWLYVRNVATVSPDPKAFPNFDDSLRRAFQRETELFLGSQLAGDRPLLELLTANYTFVNERLARHYGIPKIYGSHFRRVALTDDRRAGLLGQGSILMVTSYANRTSPVVRGKWVLENLLGVPPPPPPANVPPFPENDGTGQPRSVRERLEQHRKNPTCAACHSQLDPLGFAFENFDGVGQWRTTDAGSPIDASGVLPNGMKFTGPAEFRQVLLSQREAFLTTLTQKLLTYALGRGVEYYDMPAVRRIVADAGGNTARWSALILSVARSMPFQKRSAAQ